MDYNDTVLAVDNDLLNTLVWKADLLNAIIIIIHVDYVLPHKSLLKRLIISLLTLFNYKNHCCVWLI